jgi:hypothetical protein
MIAKSKSATTGAIKKQPAPDVPLRFSFIFFDPTDAEMCPAVFGDGYTQTLMQRLRDLSSWTVKRFTTQSDKAVRNHQHDWSKTARPEGFGALNEHYRIFPGWQFSLTTQEHGRVHGIIMNDTFYVIWLDKEHALYP